jgi:phosphatidylglycerol:prolipoprotein diacylglycerol transferase
VSSEGFRYPGALLAVAISLPLLSALFRLSIPELADAVAAPLAFGSAIGRIGCFLGGCCFGPMTSGFFGVRFPAYSPAWLDQLAHHLIKPVAPVSLPVHPLQVYFGVWSLIVGLILVVWRSHRQYPGQLFLMFLLLHETGKGVLECLRVPPNPSLQTVSAVAAAIGGLGLSLGIAIRSTRTWHEA